MTEHDRPTQPQAEAAISAKPVPGRRPTGFAGDVLKLVSGTALAQGLAVVVAPLLTRLYAPEAFGMLALFTSITGILGVVACLRYEMAIMLPETDEEAANLLALSLVAVVLMTGVSVLIVTLGRTLLLGVLNAPQLAPCLWLVPPSVLFGGILMALNYWNSRTKHFGRLAAARVASSVSSQVAKLGAGLAGQVGASSLIGATLLGSVLASSLLGYRIWRQDGALVTASVRRDRMVQGIVRYRRFPLIDIWSALLNTISWQLPALMLSHFFSGTIVGYYSLGFSVLQLPMSLIGSAIGQVFFQRAADARRNGNLDALVLVGLAQLAALCLPPTMILALAGEDIFATVFGTTWATAGSFVQILSPWVVFWFLSSPLSTVVSVMERQAMGLSITIGIVATRAISLWAGGVVGSPELALALFSSSGVALYGYALFKFLTICGVGGRAGLATLARSAVQVAPYGVPVLAAKFWGATPLVVTIVSSAVMAAWAARYVWRTSRQPNPFAGF